MVRPTPLIFAFALILCFVSVGCGNSGQQTVSSLEITSASALPSSRVNTAYSVTLGASGGVSPFTWTASGSLPPGLTLDNTGKLSGTPTQSGSFTFFATVTDSSSNRTSQSVALSVTVAEPIQVTPATLPNTSPGVMYSATLSANGGTPPYTWSITSGSLPAGLALNATTGAITGISMSAGIATFGVGVADSLATFAPVTTTMSIDVFPAPARNAVIYANQGLLSVFNIGNDGSLTYEKLAGFPSPDGPAVASPTLPLLFAVYRNQNNGLDVHSLLVNPDYSATPLTTTSVKSIFDIVQLIVDPTGANLYVTGNVIDDPSSPLQERPGISIYTANAYPQPLATIPLPAGGSNLVFTPDGTKGFLSTCASTSTGSILELSRTPDGILTPGPSLQIPYCYSSLAVSPDGKYLATDEIQIYQIASDGSLSPVLPASFTATYGGTYSGQPICASAITWANTGSFLLVGADCSSFGPGGIAVMDFAGGNLTQTYYPTESFGFHFYPQEVRSYVYFGAYTVRPDFDGMSGYQLQNGALVPLWSSWPSSPAGSSSPIVIY